MPAISFAQPPQQHLNTFHFWTAVILLILTAYPYLFNNNNACYKVAAFSAHDMDLKHRSIDEFEILQANDIIWSRSLTTRDTKEQLLNAPGEKKVKFNFPESNELDAIPTELHVDPIRKITFSSMGRRYKLVLNRPSYLTTDDLTVITLDGEGKETLYPFNINDIQILEGYVDGESGSKAVASFNYRDKLMTAQIKTGEDDMIVVEPTYLHKDKLHLADSETNSANQLPSKLLDDTMIVYRLRDHQQFQETADNNNTFDPKSFCSAVEVDSNLAQNLDQTLKENQSHFHLEEKDLYDDVFKIYMPSYDKHNHHKSIRTDRAKRGIEFFTERAKDKTRCTLHLVADYLFYKNVGNGDLQTTINYLLALINRVNQIYLPTVWETGVEGSETFKDIGFTVQNITIHQEYTRLSSGDTHYNMQSNKTWGAREFLDNFSRYSPPRYYCLAHLFTYRQFDTPVLGLAYVASPRYGAIGGICSQTQIKGDVFYKHNTGISTSKGINGETLITRQADLVVAHELGHNFGAEHDNNDCRPGSSSGGAFLMHPFAVMGFEKNNRFLSSCSRLSIGKVLRAKAATCFIAVVDHVCGNGIVEDDEECDGGDVGYGHKDPCCDSSCRFTPGSQCSDRHSWCCSKCRIQPVGIHCRPPEEHNCKQASYCNGSSPECPESPPAENNTTCVGRGLCRNGECTPFCDARKLISCLCDTPANACKLCCKSSINGTCAPYDPRGPYLTDGVLCYRGICEKGRCEQPIQDVVSRLWDVIEDINLTTFVKFLRDNIIIVVLFCSIPIWYLASYYIDEFDRRVKQDVMNAIMNRRRKGPASQSPFLPRLFVGDDISNSNSNDDVHRDDNPSNRQPGRASSSNSSKKKAFTNEPTIYRNGNNIIRPPHNPPIYGFSLPEGEEVVFGPSRNSIALNSIELPHQASNDSNSNNYVSTNVDEQQQQINSNQETETGEHLETGGSYSTQV